MALFIHLCGSMWLSEMQINCVTSSFHFAQHFIQVLSIHSFIWMSSKMHKQCTVSFTPRLHLMHHIFPSLDLLQAGSNNDVNTLECLPRWKHNFIQWSKTSRFSNGLRIYVINFTGDTHWHSGWTTLITCTYMVRIIFNWLLSWKIIKIKTFIRIAKLRNWINFTLHSCW